MTITLKGPASDKFVTLKELAPRTCGFMEPSTGNIFIHIQRQPESVGEYRMYLCLRLGHTLGLSYLDADLEVLPVDIDATWSYPK